MKFLGVGECLSFGQEFSCSCLVIVRAECLSKVSLSDP